MATSDSSIRQFQVEVSEAELTELRRRINATRWPERETVTDDSQGVRLALMQDLAGYWATDYDWHKCEAKLKALPNFITEIDGLDIHFIHVRSQHQGALPALSSPPQLGRARVSPQPRPLQHARPRRPLRRLGTARPVLRRDAGCVPDLALPRHRPALMAGTSSSRRALS